MKFLARAKCIYFSCFGIFFSVFRVVSSLEGTEGGELSMCKSFLLEGRSDQEFLGKGC